LLQSIQKLLRLQTQHLRDSSCGTSVGPRRVLVVEPDAAFRALLLHAAPKIADIDADADFLSARTHLLSGAYDWLVTNIRLDCYNGLHLVHLARAQQLPIRFLVYGEQCDPVLARDAQQAGAFYESSDRMHRALASYLQAALPPHDRRHQAALEEQVASGGGRRCTDSLSIGPHEPQRLHAACIHPTRFSVS
jgi:DNA-binding NtrC family response regulator